MVEAGVKGCRQQRDNGGHAGAVPPRWPRPSGGTTLISRPGLPSRAAAYVEEVLRSGWWGYGPVAQDLQGMVEQRYGQRFAALATSSCTAAMHLALRALGVGPGDEVVVPAFTYVSTAVVARYCGATPVFADIDPATLTVSRDTVARALSARTKAIIAVHYAGPAQDFSPLHALARERGIAVIEDAAHAFGSHSGGFPHGCPHDGAKSGPLGGCEHGGPNGSPNGGGPGEPVGLGADYVAFSFAPTKPVASSSAGMLLFRDQGQRALLNQLAFLGLAVDTFDRTTSPGVSPTQHVARLGHKYKMDDLAAAVVVAGVEQLDEIIAERAALAERYYQRLEGLAGLTLLPRPAARTAWYILPIRVAAERREALRAHLAEQRIGSTVHYPNLQQQPAFADVAGQLPVTAAVSRQVVSLPLHQGLDRAEVDRICDAVEHFLARRH